MNIIKKYWLFLTGFLISVAILWPLFAAPYFSHHDNVQIIRIYEMEKCFKDLQIPCRWVPDLGGGYGLPIFNYYAPLAYYIGAFIYQISSSLLFSAKAIFFLPVLIGYVMMYLLGRKVWGEWGGVVSAIFYTYAPYHAVNLYVRGAMGELWAMAFMPGIIWAFLRLREAPNLLNSLIVTFFLALLILSHNLTIIMFLPFVAVLALIYLFQKRDTKFFSYGVISIFFAVMISAFYLLPMALERQMIHIDSTTAGYFSYTEHFKGLRKLLLDSSWGWGDSVREVPGGAKDGLSFQIGYIHLFGWALSLLAVLILKFKRDDKTVLIIFSSAAILISIFMVHPASASVWKLIEPLKFLQFPWRFLIVITFFVSFLSGAIFSVIKNQKIKYVLFFSIVVAVVFWNFNFFRPQKFIDTSDNEQLSGDLYNQLILRSLFDYLPVSASAPPPGVASFPFEIITGLSDVYDYQSGTNWITFKSFTRTHSIIRLSTYYFPEWKIKIDGKDTRIDYENPLGLMTIILGEGNHVIEAKLYNTPIRALSNFISAFSILLFLILSLLSFERSRRKVIYYLKEFYK